MNLRIPKDLDQLLVSYSRERFKTKTDVVVGALVKFIYDDNKPDVWCGWVKI